MILSSDFKNFLREIRPTSSMIEDMQAGHKTLRKRLNEDEELADIIISDFIQGSYRRHTAVRPKGGDRADVDIIVVSKLRESHDATPEGYTPEEALKLFEPFLDKHYKNKWKAQGRSFAIELSYVELDLVLTAIPNEDDIETLTSEAVREGYFSSEGSEESNNWRLHDAWYSEETRLKNALAAEHMASELDKTEWKIHPLRIPDRDADTWEDTHPLEQIVWTRDKNARTNRHFISVVKCFKWWRLETYEDPKYPKGYPLERLIGEYCPDGIDSVAEGVVETFEAIVKGCARYVERDGKPFLPDHGVPEHDVFKRISGEEFERFYEHVKRGAKLAREAFDAEDRTTSGNKWRELFGTKFPKPPGDDGNKSTRGFNEPNAPAVPGTGRFA